MRVLVCGSRNWKDIALIYSKLGEFNKDKLLIITGECIGADNIAKRWALENEVNYLGYPAEWGLYGRLAGPIRNKKMLEAGKPDIVLAFTYDLDFSKGTKNMVQLAESRGIEVLIYNK